LDSFWFQKEKKKKKSKKEEVKKKSNGWNFWKDINSFDFEDTQEDEREFHKPRQINVTENDKENHDTSNHPKQQKFEDEDLDF